MIDYNEIDFPARLNSYVDIGGEGREYFWIFVNDEYDKANALIKAVESVKNVDSEEANKLRKDYYEFFKQYNIDVRKTVNFSYSTCLKLLVVSTANKNMSRERTICLDIEDDAAGFGCYNYDIEYHECIVKVYKKLGLSCNTKDIEILPFNSVHRRQTDVETVLRFRKSQS